MTSLSLPTKIFLYPNSPSIQFQSQHRPPQRLTFPRNIKIICSATEQPQPQPQQQQPKKKKKNNETESEKGVDPVGFLTKHGISHKAFAIFLRERYKYCFFFFFFFFKKKKVESEMECLVEEKVCEGERKLGFFYLSHNFVFFIMIIVCCIN